MIRIPPYYSSVYGWKVKLTISIIVFHFLFLVIFLGAKNSLNSSGVRGKISFLEREGEAFNAGANEES